TSFRNRKRERISSKSLLAMSRSSGRKDKLSSASEVDATSSFSFLGRGGGEVPNESKKSFASSTVIEQTSQMFLPATFTCCASRRRRAPPHSEHVEYPRYRLRKTRTCNLYFFRSRY